MKRQLDDYYSKFYCPMAERSAKLKANDNQLAKEIAFWKETVAERWDAIRVVSKESTLDEAAETGVMFRVKYVIDEVGLDDAIGLEFVVLKTDANGEDRIAHVYPFEMIGREGNIFTFECDITPDKAGSFKTAVRMYPKNEKLPHRQDFCYVRWI
jgi:starch phosphorylase